VDLLGAVLVVLIPFALVGPSVYKWYRDYSPWHRAQRRSSPPIWPARGASGT